MIGVSDLPHHLKQDMDRPLPLDGIPDNATLPEILTMVEIELIERALRRSNNVQSRAAQLLGIGKSGLNQKIKKYHLDVGSKA